jgi:hypothetical protein
VLEASAASGPARAFLESNPVSESQMKTRILVGVSSALCLGVLPMAAQETTNVEQLRKQLGEMQRKFEQTVQEQREQIHALEQKLEQLKAPPVAEKAAAGTPESGQIQDLKKEVDSVVEAQKKILPSEFNPAIGLVGETVFSYNGRASDQTGNDRPGGFDVFQRSLELNVSASVDPFAKAYAVLNASADSATGEANLGLEEAALQTTSLPWGLELKAGRFFGEFGKLSDIHDHELPFVNRPLALDQYIGGESRTDGAQLSWLLPTDHYVSAVAGFGNGFGGDSPLNNPGTYRPLGGLNYFGRLSTYFDLTPDFQMETGVSGLINPTTQDRGGVLVQPDGSTLTERARRVAGLDLKLSYVPLADNQFRRVDWGTEVLYSDSRYWMDPDGSLDPANGGVFSGDESKGGIGSFGLYSYVTYKWSRQWSAGFLFDWVQSAENNERQTFAYSPYLTFAFSHWNQLRLQYTRTEHNAVSGLPSDDAVYLQWTWIIGAHAHGWQQR